MNEEDESTLMKDDFEGTETDDDAKFLVCDEDESSGTEINTEDFQLNLDSRITFERFEKWNLSPDGGEKEPKSVSLVVRQLEKILIMPGTENIESLLDKAQIRDKFYPESKATLKAGTTISYLHSLRTFYTFAMTEDDVGISQECVKMADALYRKCGKWNKSLRKDVKRRFWEKRQGRFVSPHNTRKTTRVRKKRKG